MEPYNITTIDSRANRHMTTSTIRIVFPCFLKVHPRVARQEIQSFRTPTVTLLVRYRICFTFRMERSSKIYIIPTRDLERLPSQSKIAIEPYHVIVRRVVSIRMKDPHLIFAYSSSGMSQRIMRPAVPRGHWYIDSTVGSQTQELFPGSQGTL